jgi:hypothetical protein
MQKDILHQMLEQSKMDCSRIFKHINSENIGFRLTEKTASVGFIHRHIGELTNLIAQFFGYKTDVEGMTLNQIDTGKRYDIETSRMLFGQGYDTLKKIVNETPDNNWLEEIETAWFGKISRIKLFSLTLFHNSHHCGQIASAIVKGQDFSHRLDKQSEDFKLALLTERTPQEVYKAILNVRAWWTGYHNEEFTGSTENLGDVFSFSAADGIHKSTQKIVELIPNKKIVWLVTDSSLSFLERTDEWIGTKIIFEITRQGNKTQLVFTHEGLTPEIECYNSCAPSWTAYLTKKLLLLIDKPKDK